jgi:stress response protein SCP2
MDFGIKNNVSPPLSFGSSSQQQGNQQQVNQQQQMNQQPMNQQQQFNQQQQMNQQPMNQQQQFNQQQQMNQQPMNQQPMNQQQFNQPINQQQVNQQQLNQHPAAGMGVSLRKGQKFSLSKINASLDNIMVGLGWDVTQQSSIPHDLDVQVFMLGANDKVIGDDWFVFYNKLVSPDGSVRHSGDNRTGIGSGDDEVIMIQLSRVTPEVQKLVFVVTVSEALERGHNFGQVSNAYIRIVDQSTNNEIMRYNLTEYYSSVISMVVGEVYKHNNEWKFNPVGDGTADDLIGLCSRYGVKVQ